MTRSTGSTERSAATRSVAAFDMILLTVSYGLVRTVTTADNPDPAVHQMTRTPDSVDRASGLSFAMDRLAMNIHP